MIIKHFLKMVFAVPYVHTYMYQ